MLTRLAVTNLAVVEAAAVEFGAGLNVITGETGAGKSVLMGALELVLGARADTSAVREGAKEARIEAEFDSADSVAGLAELLDDAGIPPCEDGILVVRRVISANGGGRVHVNDASATVQTLRALGKLLVDVHGPNDHQSLLAEAFQRRLVDSFGGVDLAPYSAAWKLYSDLLARRAELLGDVADVAEEEERLRYAVAELDAAALTEEDETELPARHAAAAHAAEIAEGANAVTSALAGDDGTSAAEALAAAAARLNEMARYHESAAEWRDEVEDLAVRAQELSRTVADEISRIDADPETLQELDDRLTLVSRLKRKYACANVGELIALRGKRAARLDDLENRASRLEKVENEIAAARKEVDSAAASLSSLRRKAATRFAAAVTKELRALGFLQAGFGAKISTREPDASGRDAVEFLFEPNPGEPQRPLADVASTGEVARVMLAVKTVAAAHDSVPVLVFDEIDSNVGGETGRAVGEKLRAVSRHRQVIAITHLPQSAVYGDRHFAVAKSVSGGRTRTEITSLDGEARVAEISRMLGGAKLTSVVTRHAEELLALARA